jgi:flagellar assembly protein FliH
MSLNAHGADTGQSLILRKAAVAAKAVRVGARKAAASAPSADAAATEQPGGSDPGAKLPEIDLAAQIEAAREQARTEGYAEGFASGDKEAKRELAQRVAALERLLASIEGAHEAALAGLEDLALGIAWEAVCKIIGELAATRQGIRALVEEGANKVRSEEKMVIRLCPADLEILAGGGESLEGESGLGRMEFLADASIATGGCIIETGAGRIDATLETQLARLREALLAVRLARKEARP